MQFTAATPGSTVVIADDLSGAAECAAEFTPSGGSACLRLAPGRAAAETGAPAGVVVWDLDTRDRPPVLPAPLIACLTPARRTYVKIDSLLRGNWADLVAAVVRTTGRPALMCPALPRLGRSLRDGRIDLSPGHGLLHYTGSVIEGLGQAGLAAGLHRLHPASDDALRKGLLAALRRHPVTVVDARTDEQLDAMARVLESLPEAYVGIGSAGLAGALARTLSIGRSWCAPGPLEPMAVLVGSRTGPAREQLARLARASGEPVCWWRPGHGLEGLPAGEMHDAPLRLYATRPDDSTAARDRDLARQFAEAVLAQTPAVATYVATGGETARALCDALGLDHLDILGQLEPGVCLARLPLPGGAKHLVLKSGSFGDPATLVRIAHGDGTLHATERQA